MLRRLVLLGMMLATTVGVSGLIKGWPRTYLVCGAILVTPIAIFFAGERVARSHQHIRENE